MKLTIIAKTIPTNKTEGEIREVFENFGGKAAGVCYMRENYNTLANEDKSLTDRRIKFCKQSGHHSVFDHLYISLCIEDAPKMLAMLLNNERMYSTSEKSGRYAKMSENGLSQELFEKWSVILERKIEEVYANESYVMKAKEKLARENARYFFSVMMPMTMIYTVSYRQINLLYGFAKKMILQNNPIANLMRDTLTDFCTQLDNLGVIDEMLIDNGKGRIFSLIEEDCTRPEYFGDVYSTNNLGTSMYIAHAHRHRTLKYSISLLNEPQFFVPEIIKNTPLEKDWLADMESIKDTFPQGMLVNINERGTVEDFILKTKERHCARAQLETAEQTFKVMKKYLKNAEPRVVAMLEPYNKSRCLFHDFKCKEPCGFADGIKGTRKI